MAPGRLLRRRSAIWYWAEYGTHHHYSDDDALAYAVEACYKYNVHKSGNLFDSLKRTAV